MRYMEEDSYPCSPAWLNQETVCQLNASPSFPPFLSHTLIIIFSLSSWPHLFLCLGINRFVTAYQTTDLQSLWDCALYHCLMSTTPTCKHSRQQLMVSSFTSFSAYRAEYTSNLIKTFTYSPVDDATWCDSFLSTSFEWVQMLVKIDTRMAQIQNSFHLVSKEFPLIPNGCRSNSKSCQPSKNFKSVSFQQCFSVCCWSKWGRWSFTSGHTSLKTLQQIFPI